MKKNTLIISFVLLIMLYSLAKANPIQRQAIQIAAGGYHSLALKASGTVWAWGRNSEGQLGEGTATEGISPVLVPGLLNVTMIAAGDYHSLALREDCSVWTWGYNRYGQLGDGTTTNKNRPVLVSGLSHVTMIAAGANHSLAIKDDGSVWAWGYNRYDQLGDGTTTNKSSPVQVSGLSHVTMIAAGADHSLAIKDDGSVWAWGYNSYGQLGDGTATNKSTPVKVSDLSHVTMIAAGYSHSLAIKDDGSVWAWGYNSYGQLGDGTNTNKSSPVQMSGLSHATMISAGNHHGLAIQLDGSVWAWGNNSCGQLADGTTTNKSSPVQVSEFSNVTMIATGNHHSLAIKDDGSVWIWGHNCIGQLADGTTTNKNNPIQTSRLSHVNKVAVGYSHSLAIKDNGSLWAWGSNSHGKLGDETSINRSSPVQVSGIEDVNMVAAGSYHSLAIKNDKSVWAWGGNFDGQLGDGSFTNKSCPIQVPGLLHVTMIAAGHSHSLALKDDGSVWAWGYNHYGQIGHETITDISSPVRVLGLSHVNIIASAGNHNLALKDDGSVWSWGDNNYGQLGDGTTTSKTSPVQIPELSNITMIATSNSHSLALKNDGSVWAWGSNNYGQLGDGSTTNKSSPIQISEFSNVTMIAAGNSHSLALKVDGSAWAWGYNNYGQLGDGTTTNTSRPIQVSGLSDVIMIAAEDYYSLSIKDDGTVWTWGNNNCGQLGNGYPRYLPEPVYSEIQCQPKYFITSQNTTIKIPVINTAQKNTIFSYTTIDDTAISGVDYLHTSGYLTFQANEKQKEIPITIMNNPENLTNKTFMLNIGSPDDIFLNYGSQAIITIPSRYTVNAPYSQTFNQNIPAHGWTYHSQPNGRIQQIDGRLRMDSIQDNTHSLNEATLHIYLSPLENVRLNFYQKNIASYTCTTLPPTFLNQFNGDGVSLSNDGHTWYPIMNSMDLQTDAKGKNYTCYLSDIEYNIQTTYDEHFRLNQFVQIKFQQYGKLSSPYGGREWDNISLTAKPIPIIQFQQTTHMIPNEGYTYIPVLRYGNLDTTASVDYATQNGSAIAGQDYVELSGQLVFEPGDTVRYIKVIVLADIFRNQDIAFQLTLSNPSEGYDLLTPRSCLINISCHQHFSQNYVQSFDHALPASGWKYYSSDSHGRIQIKNNALHMDATTSLPILNEAELSMDFPWAHQVNLSFSKVSYETSDPIPDRYTGHANGDGVSISTDGITWYAIANAADLDSPYTEMSVNLNQKIADINLQYGTEVEFCDDFRIRFQQYNNQEGMLARGRQWDNINVQVSGDVLELDTDIIAMPDDIFTIPLTLNNPNQQPIEGIYAVLTVDNSVLIPQSASLEGGFLNLDDYQVDISTDVPNEMLISIYCRTSAFSYSSGTVAFLTFQAGSSRYSTSTIAFDVAEINETPVNAREGHFTISGARISGNVVYYANDIPVRNVLMTLAGESTYTAVTDENGQYVISDVPPGYYKLSPSKDDDLLGVSQTDASDIARLIINNSQGLTCTTRIAGDVSLNRYISPKDVSDTSTYAVPGLLKSCINEICQPWTFSSIRPTSCIDQVVQSTPYRQYISLETDQTDQDFIAFRLGDVTGNWQPGDAPTQSTHPETQYSARIVKTEFAQESYPFTVAIAIDEPFPIRGIDIGISFDPDIIEAVSAQRIGTLLDHSDYELIYGTGIRGEISLGVYTNDDILTTSGEMIIIQFHFIGNENSRSFLAFQRFSINEQPVSGGFLVDTHLRSSVEVALDNGVPMLYDTANEITPINSPPVAYSKDVFVDEDKHIYIKLIATDPDNDHLSYHLLDLPSHGTVSQVTNTVLYSPDMNYNGSDGFTYKVTDGFQYSDIASMMITIYPVDDPPQASNQSICTTENMSVGLTLNGFSPDNKPLTFLITEQPMHGNLSQSTSYLTYTPDTDFNGMDAFMFIVNDGLSNSEPATVSITVDRKDSYVLSLSGVGYGTIKFNSTSVLLPWESRFQRDQHLCFEAVPDSDWRFINWTGDLQTSENPACLTLNKNKIITAHMAKKTYELSIQGNETITINNNQQRLPFSQFFDIHTPVSIESASDRFHCWEGDIQTFQNPYEFTIHSNMAITANFYPVPDWQTEIHVDRKIDNTDIMQHNSVYLGIASQAYSRSAGDLPNKYSCDIVLNDQSFNALKKYIKQDNLNEYQWLIAVDPHGSEGNPYVQTIAILSWDASRFSPEGQYVLKSNTDDEILISNMRLTTEYEVSGTSYSSFTIIWQRHKTFDFHLTKGWNLISLPLLLSNSELNNLFPDYEAAFEYKNGGYASVTSMIPGKGYWLKIPTQKVYSISGQPFPTYSIELTDGWHLIGGSFHEMLIPDDLSIKVMYRYENGGYEQAFTVMPGFGYWIKNEK